MVDCVHTFLYLLFCFFMYGFCSARDSITITQFLRDPETLESSKAVFKFGFFSPDNSSYRYAGIWYRNESDGLEVVWVANRLKPLCHLFGVIKIAGDGNLHIFDGQNKSFWSTNVTVADKDVNGVAAQILDNGNLVLLSNYSENVIWQSFDHPTETVLSHMKVINYVNKNKSPVYTSWKSPSDPSIGRFTFGLVQRSLSELRIWDGDWPYWRSGPWDGHVFMGVRAMYYFADGDGIHIQYDNESTLSLSFYSVGRAITEHYVLTDDGMLLQKDWVKDTGKWVVLWQTLENECDVYGKCGEFGSCNSMSSPICSCLKGFEPRDKQEWSAGNWSTGCVRRTPLHCGTVRGESDGFLRLRNMKVPDNAEPVYTYNEEGCAASCLRNCSCLSYTYSLGFGCIFWMGSLMDIQEFKDVGNDFFLRLAHSELGAHSVPPLGNISVGGSRALLNTTKWKVIVAIIVIISAVAIFVILHILWRWIKKRHGNAGNDEKNKVQNGASDVEFEDLTLFKFEDLLVATNRFSENNQLGRGGFGLVYKGELKDGQEIAVKRLSRASRQGLQEFKNELVVISKLQHKNLVRLLGSCIEGEEKLLVYEYMPNKSLDCFIFKPSNRENLDWKKRCNIINGISRGLLYLHRDSRMKIIHRDLKASNILLDENLNPKISDFGMARIFRGNQDQGDTKRIVGTYGYMSPEYAMDGRFSEKSDVFSFGVLLLEIISGRRNNGFIEDEESVSLFAHAWYLWNEGKLWSFIDPNILEPAFKTEILRFIQLGLLCVQEFPKDRPTISMVVSMIENEGTDLPCPTQPGFTQRRNDSSQIHGYTGNGASISSLVGR